MDMSFAIQAKGLEYLATHEKMKPTLYAIPAETDKEVATLKLSAMALGLDVLTEEQKEYLGV